MSSWYGPLATRAWRRYGQAAWRVARQAEEHLKPRQVGSESLSGGVCLGSVEHAGNGLVSRVHA